MSTILFTVSVVWDVHPQSPVAAKLKTGKVDVLEGEAYTKWSSVVTPSILVDDKITIAATIISKKTEGKIVGEDIFLSDIPFSSINKQILTIFAVLI